MDVSCNIVSFGTNGRGNVVDQSRLLEGPLEIFILAGRIRSTERKEEDRQPELPQSPSVSACHPWVIDLQ
jgi:hypothetical protein